MKMDAETREKIIGELTEWNNDNYLKGDTALFNKLIDLTEAATASAIFKAIEDLFYLWNVAPEEWLKIKGQLEDLKRKFGVG